MALPCRSILWVDDAIVMIEIVFESRKGMSPCRRHSKARGRSASRDSISVSLFAAFIPLLFMNGIVGRCFREILGNWLGDCGVDRRITDGNAHDLRAFRAQARAGMTWLDRMVEPLHGLAQGRLCAQPECRVGAASLTLVVMAGAVLTTLVYSQVTRKGYSRPRHGVSGQYASVDGGLLQVDVRLQQAPRDRAGHPAVNAVGSSIGTSG